ncbi:MAG: hypothetical protein NDI94_06555 [Candidatus Woesearchaeota archaeon]|nr:hypothetical protein [Candidatus Woesearchaeota archaeon]
MNYSHSFEVLLWKEYSALSYFFKGFTLGGNADATPFDKIDHTVLNSVKDSVAISTNHRKGITTRFGDDDLLGLTLVKFGQHGLEYRVAKTEDDGDSHGSRFKFSQIVSSYDLSAEAPALTFEELFNRSMVYSSQDRDNCNKNPVLLMTFQTYMAIAAFSDTPLKLYGAKQVEGYRERLEKTIRPDFKPIALSSGLLFKAANTPYLFVNS